MTDRLRTDTGPFTIVPEWLIYSGISARAIQTYAVLGRHADKAGENAFPSLTTLSKLMKCSKERVQTAIKELEKANAVTIEPRFRKDGSRTSNEYKLIRATPTDVSATPTDVSATPTENDPPALLKIGGVMNDNPNNESEPSLRSGSYVPVINEVWKVYLETWRLNRKDNRGKEPILTDQRKQLVRDRVKEGFTVDRLVAAVEGNFRDPYCCGKNPTGTEYHSFDLIMRNAKQVERYESVPLEAPGQHHHDRKAAQYLRLRGEA